VTQHHPEGAKQTAALAPRPDSETLWGLRWSDHAPWHYDDVSIDASCLAEALPFVSEHYDTIFGAGRGRFYADAMTPAKRRFYERCDVFVFRAEGNVVGVSFSHPTDWSSYYLRSTAFLKSWQGRHGMRRMIDRLSGPLRGVGCDRIECEVSPTNAVIMRMLIGEGWIATGNVHTERFGALVRMTRFLRPEPADVFAERFGATSNPLRHAPFNGEKGESP